MAIRVNDRQSFWYWVVRNNVSDVQFNFPLPKRDKQCWATAESRIPLCIQDYQGHVALELHCTDNTSLDERNRGLPIDLFASSVPAERISDKCNRLTEPKGMIRFF